MNKDAELLYLDRQLCFRLYTASRLIIRAYQPMLKALEITYPQYLVLMLLWEWQDSGREHGSITQLGERLQLDSGTLTPLLKRMESNGLLSRQRSEVDERQLEVRLTQEGIELRAKVMAWFAEFLPDRESKQQELSELAGQLDSLMGLMS